MAVGLHSVLVYPDPAAGGWSAPLASNPYLTTDATGWGSGPFTDAWTWSGGAVTGGTSFVRARTSPVPRVAAGAYRLRVVFTVQTVGDVFWGVYFGTTPAAAEVGPFWDAANAAQLSQARTLQPGTHSVETVWDPSTMDPRYLYLGPNVQFSPGMAPRVDTVHLTFQGAEGIDLSCLVDDVSVSHGRDGPSGQPEASAATVSLSTDATTAVPADVEVGAVLVVNTATASGVSERFVGRITDVSLGWDDAGQGTPDAGVGQIVAAGSLSDLGRRVVGDTPWPQELDGARINRVMTAAGVSLDPLLSDPGTVQLLPRDVDSTDALSVAHDAAQSASGIVWQTRGGEVRYADADHRRATPPSLTLDACNLLVTPTWRRNTEGLVNSVSLGYGVIPEGSEQPRFVDSDAASMTKWGTYEYSTATALAALADAQAMGRLLLTRNKSPVWVMAALPVDVDGLSDDEYEALLGLDVHALVILTGLPAIGAAPTSATLWVEGWKETLTYGGHALDLVVSGYCRTAPPPRWDDLTPATVWGDVTLTETRRNKIVEPNPPGPANWAGVAAGGAITTTGPFSHNVSATPGQVWTVAVDVTAPAGSPVSGFVAAYPTAGGSFTIGSPTTTPFTVPAGQTMRVANTNTIPTGQNGLRLYLSVNVADGTAGLGRAQMERTPAAGTYFDGSTPDTDAMDYAWVGTPNASESVESVRTDSPTPGEVPPELTWDDAACLGPPANLGRWNDQPATLRWDQVPPATAWNTYV